MENEYISREAVKNAIHRDLDMQDLYLPIEFIELLDDIPAADVRPVVRGKWIRGKQSMTGPGKDSYVCSICGEKTLSGFCGNPAKTNFCPNCGADMRPEPPEEGA